jgi:RNA ligase
VKLEDLVEPGLLHEMTKEGYIRQQWHPALPLCIWNYTEKAQFDWVWNDATRTCRGLITDFMTGDVVARPFPKFFNYGEEDVAAGYYFTPVTVTDKLDGSLGILYPTGHLRWAIATRGSFTSTQALHATERLEEYLVMGWHPERGMTYLFEIIYPDNRIVCNYHGTDDLFLLGKVSIEDGWSTGPFGDWPGPRAKIFGYKNFQEAIAAQPRPGAEGMVVHFIDLDKRLKIKQPDYVMLHRIVTGLNERTVWEHLSSGGSVRELCSNIPDDFHPWVYDTADWLFGRYYDLDRAARHAFESMPRDGSRKHFALEAKKHTLAKYLFRLYDGKDIGPLLWADVRPPASRGPWKQGEDVG